MNSMRRFHYANVVLHSAVDLPSLKPAENPKMPLGQTIRIASPRRVAALPNPAKWQMEWPDPSGNISMMLALETAPEKIATKRFRMRSPGTCDFLIEMDAESVQVTIEHIVDLAANTLEHLLLDQVLPRILSETGSFVLHASGLKIQHVGVLFVGHSGYGKSTLSSLLLQTGASLLSDDCVLLETTHEGIRATATYPSLRLLQDSVQHSGITPPKLNQVAAYTVNRPGFLGGRLV